MNSFEKILTKKADNTIKSQENIVNQAKELLANNDREEREVLRKSGLFRATDYVEDKNIQRLERIKTAKRLGKTIVSESEILKMCKDYRLQIRPCNQYIGTIPADLGAELVRWTKENNIPIPESSSYSNFSIIAPPKMFINYKPVGQVLADAFNRTIEERKERIRLEKEDPILVYKLPDGMYAIIKSWGNDFTPLRRFYAIMTTGKTINRINFLITLLFSFISFKLAWLFGGYFGDKSNKSEGWESFYNGAGAFAVWVVPIVLICLWLWSEDCQKFRNYLKRGLRLNIKGERQFDED